MPIEDQMENIMSKSKVRTKARVRILLEICLADTWGGDCPLSQVYKQSKDSANSIISQKIASSMKYIKMIGKTEVEAILVEE